MKTGDKLFDSFWEAYPTRNTKKIGKKKCVAKFKLKKYGAETVALMLDWIGKDIDNREAVRRKGQFYADPCDPIVFLNNERWEDPIGVVINETQHRETHRSKAVYSKNVAEKIKLFENIIHEWPIERLRGNKTFMSAYGAYPEFRTWVNELLPDRKKADKADNPPCPPPLKAKNAVATPFVAIKKPDIVQDLPPPSSGLDRILEFVGDVKQAKKDGRIENIVRGANLF